jgi:DNA-directed RNA polymerase sigma subunit (sigma70/sigma32)
MPKKFVFDHSGFTNIRRTYSESMYNLLSKKYHTKDEQNCLIELAQGGNKLAKDELITSNMRLVVSIAKRMATTVSFSYEDVLIEGF